METLPAYNLPPGFGFHPTDVELVSHYLKKKLSGMKIEFEVIPEVDIYKLEPWDLPAKCNIPTKDSKWHFFTARDRKYPNGARANRATEAGYWKSTGKDRNIKFKNRIIGTKKTLVFHEGRPPHGKRSDWIMHEYYMDEKELKAFPNIKEMFVLCRVTKRNGLEPEEDLSPQISDVGNRSSSKTEEKMSGLNIESPSSCDNPDDFEAWFAELYDPSAAPTFNDILIESKELPSHAPKQEPVPSFSDELDLLLSRDDQHQHVEADNFVSNMCRMVDSETVGVPPDHEEVELDEFLSSLLVDEHPENTTEYELSGTLGNSIGDQYTSLEDELDKNEEHISTGENMVETGIQIRKRHGKPFQGVISSRIKLQLYNQPKANREISATYKVDNRDLNHNMDYHYTEGYVSDTGTDDTRESILEKRCMNLTTIPCNRIVEENLDTLPISELDSLSVLDRTIGFSAYENRESTDTGLTTGMFGGVCLFLRRFSSYGLNRVFLFVTIMVLLILFFFLCHVEVSPSSF